MVSLPSEITGVNIRNKLSSMLQKGPRKFKLLKGQFSIRFSNQEFANQALDKLKNLGFEPKRFKNNPIVKIKPRKGVKPQEIFKQVLRKGVGGRGRRRVNIRNVKKKLNQLAGSVNVDYVFSKATFGPPSLGIKVERLKSRLSRIREMTTREKEEKPTQEALLPKIGVKDAWENLTRGEDAIACIFDTSFCEDFFSSDRIIDTFHGEDVESAFSAPEEGHGTMTAVAMAGNAENAPFNGIAPDADLLLARLTNKEGSLVYTMDAWDWLMDKADELDRPIVSSHSYGIPLCSGRREWCRNNEAFVIKKAVDRPDLSANYAAGNEAGRCGHRLFRGTNAVTGVNSLADVFTTAAFRWDLRDAQWYSSHGPGDCAAAEDPKPNFGCMLPDLVAYGCDVKDMSDSPRMIGGFSGGGTSLATPLVSGVMTLMKSLNPELPDMEMKRILKETAELPRTTQVNTIRGRDSRFGYGQVYATKVGGSGAVEVVRRRM